MAADSDWWTVAEAAEKLKVSPRTIRRYIAAGLPEILGRVRRSDAQRMYRDRLLREKSTRATRGPA